MSTCDISDFITNVHVVGMLRPLEDSELDLIGQVLIREHEYWLSDDERFALCGLILWGGVQEEQ